MQISAKDVLADFFRKQQEEIHKQKMQTDAPSKQDPVQTVSKNELNNKLFSAARTSDYDEVQRLLNSGADVDAKDPEGNTALVIACFHDSIAVVKLLVYASADVNARGGNGVSVLFIAKSYGRKFNRTDIVTFLVKHGAKD